MPSESKTITYASIFKTVVQKCNYHCRFFCKLADNLLRKIPPPRGKSSDYLLHIFLLNFIPSSFLN